MRKFLFAGNYKGFTEVEAVEPEYDLPKLPLARALWKPYPDMQTGCAHHICYSQNLTSEHLEDFAEMAGIEFVKIDKSSTIRSLKKELRVNEIYYKI